MHTHIHTYIHTYIHTHIITCTEKPSSINTYAAEDTSELFSAVFMSPSTSNEKHIDRWIAFEKTTK